MAERCKGCPPDDETARQIAEAFGLPGPVIDRGPDHEIRLATSWWATDTFHRAMWHALVKCYADYVPSDVLARSGFYKAD